MLPSDGELISGTRVGNYELRHKLGEGGMGVVYLCEHPIIGRRVALKVLKPELAASRESVERFFAEARAVNAIGHPNIIDVFDLGQTPDGLWYFTMEYLDGENLAQSIARRHSLPPSEAVAIAEQVASALGAAHRTGIIHRDVKPHNIFLARRGEGTHVVKVLDFGVAKLTSPLVDGFQSRTGTIIGTPNYMAPEQCESKRGIDTRADIYSLGAVLFEMVCGRPPFVGEGLGILLKQMHESPPRPSELCPSIPTDLEGTILRALEKLPEARFSSMEEFRERIVHAVGHQPAPTPYPVAATPIPQHSLQPVQAPSVVQVRRRPWLGVAAALSLLAAVTLGIVVTQKSALQAPSPKPEHSLNSPSHVATLAPAVVPAPVSARIHLRSDPTGAEVWRHGAKEPLGTTPLDVELLLSDRPVEFVFRKTGFREHRRAIVVVGDAEIAVHLEALSARTERPQPARKASSRGASGKRIKGLANDL